MSGQQQQDKVTGFKTIILFKDQPLGIGSYGAVCKAKCDDLLCAAKIIHPTLFDPTALHQITPHREHRLPIRRFRLECEFLSTVRHPNIVQCLGTHQDPDTGLPVLLMELMDDSLTHFLESSPQLIPYHIQINVCHDITLALSYLHSNGIVHRDLSSNNVLLISNVRAKVTDFGMARLGNQNPRATHLTFTMCPGTDVYMPPEAVQDKSEYTEKIDCFSFGVIIVQIVTRQFPKPGDRQVTLDDPRYPQGAVKLCVPEIERRQKHISTIDPNHPLKRVALDCLKDRDVERPSAQQLCERVAVLKEDPQYSESVRALREKDKTIVELRESAQQIGEKKRELTEKVEEIDQLKRELGRVNQQLEESEQIIAQFQRRIAELEQLRPATDTSSSSQVQSDTIKLTWRKGKEAPCKVSDLYCAAVDGSILYIHHPTSHQTFKYNASTSSWSRLPDSPIRLCSTVIINNLFTLVGGCNHVGTHSNQLFSLTREGSGWRWTKEFPPMPTKRTESIVLCTGVTLIVAGGWVSGVPVRTVDVLNSETKWWSTAADLPKHLSPSHTSAAICGDKIFLVGKAMYTCSIQPFLASIRSRGASVWKQVTAPPVIQTTCVFFHGQLLAVGGKDSKQKSTTAIHMYNPTTNSWEVISHMGTPRTDCIAAVLPNNQLMVVGGTINYEITASVEFATIIE